MKTWKIFFGLALILAAVLLVLDALGIAMPWMTLVGEVSWFALLIGLLLVAFIIASLSQGKLSQIFFPIAILFWMFEENIATLMGRETSDLLDNRLVLLVAILFTVGFAIIESAFRRRRRSGGHFSYGHSGSERGGGSLGSSVVYVDAESMRPGVVENNLGACAVRFENVERYPGDGVLRVENNLGAMTVHVPEGWRVEVHVENNLGSVSAPRGGDGDGPLLTVSGENNLGALTVRYG